MEPIQVGLLSILPPIIAIALSLITKEVISSLLIGIISGTCIYSFFTNGGIIKTVELTFLFMSKEIGRNAFVLIFLGLLGALVVVVTKVGGSKAYGKWAAKAIKSKSLTQLSAIALGILISIDDYFNCLTVGTIMRPIVDQKKISREKLAYLIDATAAPICIIAPISSWAASVVSYIDATGINGMSTFLKTIPYNIYAILTIAMLLFVSIKNFDFGPMQKFEKIAMEKEILKKEDNEKETLNVSEKSGKVYDLVVPIIMLVFLSLLSMVYIGGYFSKTVSFLGSFGRTNASLAITYGAFGALIVAFLMFVPRKLLSFKDFMRCITEGIKSMVPAFVILILAWTISGICRDVLGTSEYIGNLVEISKMPLFLMPCIVFIIAGVLSFSMGTSWGTFGIMIPIVVMVCQKAAPDLMIITLAATLAGSVFGDHCSLISDTTILSSTSAGCNHIDHVSSQMPYACLVAGVSFIGYIVAGISKNLMIVFLTVLPILFVTLCILHKISSGEVKSKG